MSSPTPDPFDAAARRLKALADQAGPADPMEDLKRALDRLAKTEDELATARRRIDELAARFEELRSPRSEPPGRLAA